MTLREILTRATEIVGTVSFDPADSDGEQLISCARFVCAECADRYADLVARETVTSTEKRIPFSSLTHSVKRILSVKRNGRPVPFRQEIDGIGVDADGSYETEYAYFSERKNLDETLDLPAYFSIDALTFGTVAEYYLRNGFVEDSLLYKNRYDQAVRNDLRQKKAGYLPYRRFV